MGIEPTTQSTTGVGTRYAVAGPVTNVIARIPGIETDGPAVLLMAHYDAVPASPGAGDDGSGGSKCILCGYDTPRDGEYSRAPPDAHKSTIRVPTLAPQHADHPSGQSVEIVQRSPII